MLPKKHRLIKGRDFVKVLRTGAPNEDKVLRVKIISNKKNFCRFGFIVSAKVARKATERNLVKRRLRHATRLLLPSLKPGFDIIVWLKIKDIKLEDLVPSLGLLLKRIIL